MKINDKVIIKETKQDSVITASYEVNNGTFYEVANSNKAYTEDELLVYEETTGIERKTFNDQAYTEAQLSVVNDTPSNDTDITVDEMVHVETVEEPFDIDECDNKDVLLIQLADHIEEARKITNRIAELSDDE